MKTKTIKLEFDMDKIDSKFTFDFVGVDNERASEIGDCVRKNALYDSKSEDIKHILEMYNDAEAIVALIYYGGWINNHGL